MRLYNDNSSGITIECEGTINGAVHPPFIVVVNDTPLPPGVVIVDTFDNEATIIPVVDWPKIRDAVDELLRERGYER